VSPKTFQNADGPKENPKLGGEDATRRTLPGNRSEIFRRYSGATWPDRMKHQAGSEVKSGVGPTLPAGLTPKEGKRLPLNDERDKITDADKLRLPAHGRSGPDLIAPSNGQAVQRHRLDAGLGHAARDLALPSMRTRTKQEIQDLARTRFPDRLKSGQLDRVTKGQVARKLNLSEQYKMLQHGDVARRLELHKNVNHISKSTHVTSVTNVTNITNLAHHGVHRPTYHHHHPQGYYFGRISPRYVSDCFEHRYHGPRFFASVCYYPRWAPWVRWSWHYHCYPVWDPRPIWCRPIVYEPCVSWVYYDVPVWTPLPAAASGTWVDVQRVVVPAAQDDVQLLAVRFVDPGHPEEKLGPRYRVWFRNNSDRPVATPLDVMLFAGNDDNLGPNLPQAGVRVTAIEAGDTQSVDIRLPFEVYSMNRDAEGRTAPFAVLHALVDANRELNETIETNNGSRIPAGEVLPVDPAAFELEPKQAPAGSEITLAGEGLGPEPGQVLVHLAGLELEGEIVGWYDLGVRFSLPNVPLAGPTEGEVIVVRGDGAASNPLPITVTPTQQ